MQKRPGRKRTRYAGAPLAVFLNYLAVGTAAFCILPSSCSVTSVCPHLLGRGSGLLRELDRAEVARAEGRT